MVFKVKKGCNFIKPEALVCAGGRGGFEEWSEGWV